MCGGKGPPPRLVDGGGGGAQWPAMASSINVHTGALPPQCALTDTPFPVDCADLDRADLESAAPRCGTRLRRAAARRRPRQVPWQLLQRSHGRLHVR